LEIFDDENLGNSSGLLLPVSRRGVKIKQFQPGEALLSTRTVRTHAIISTTPGGFGVAISMEPSSTLAQLIETRIRALTHGRIRNLRVEEIQGRVVLHGNVPSHHTRQLALHGALELLAGDRVTAQITVG
jgi:hypothetical protein